MEPPLLLLLLFRDRTLQKTPLPLMAQAPPLPAVDAVSLVQE